MSKQGLTPLKLSEESFLASLSLDPIPLPSMLSTLNELHAAGDATSAETWSDLLYTTLSDRNAADSLLQLFQLQAQWHPNDRLLKTRCAEQALIALGKHESAKVIVDAAGFNTDMPVQSCLARLANLRTFAPDKLCYDKTWGFGIIRRIDVFYKKIHVDFRTRKDHEMSLSYAAEVLSVLPEDHILAIAYRNPEEFKSRTSSEPGQLVKLALQSYGGMSVALLHDVLIRDKLITEADWKPFWSNARKALKSDPLVVIPAKHNEVIAVLDEKKQFDTAWFAALAAEKVPENIAASIEELISSGDISVLRSEPETAALLRTAVSSAFSAFSKRRPALEARLLSCLHQLHVDVPQTEMNSLLDSFFSGTSFIDASKHLSAKQIRHFLAGLYAHQPERAVELFSHTLQQMSLTLLGETFSLLQPVDSDHSIVHSFREYFLTRSQSAEMLCIIAKQPGLVSEWQLGSVADLMDRVMLELQTTRSGEGLKAQRRLRQLLDDRKWFGDVLGRMDRQEVENLVLLLRNSISWSGIDRNTLIARMVSIRPELQVVLASESKEPENEDQDGGYTSWHSLNLRTAELERLERKGIPDNAKAIALARSYGDLKENHAYKAAKEEQSILLARRDALELELTRIKGTYFESVSCDAVRPGTTVALGFPDGTELVYHVLGEWDSDHSIGIVSSRSRLAQQIRGRKVNEEVEVPSETGQLTPCRILSISPLPEDIQAWVSGRSHSV